VSTYSDLMAPARLCLRQANTARTPAAADELRRLAKEYEGRAASLGEGASLPSNVQLSHAVQQQQQPQADPAPAASGATIGFGTMLRTGVSTPSDFAPERLSRWGPFGDAANRGDLRGARETRGGNC
jgi:hypothetical protein